MEQPEVDAINLLSIDYKEDLQTLRKLTSSTSLSVISENNMKALGAIYYKYSGKRMKITRENYADIGGELQYTIRQKMEQLASKVLGKELEKREDRINEKSPEDNVTDYDVNAKWKGDS